MNHNRYVLGAAVLLVLIASGVIWGQSDQPSLADVAKHKPAAKAKHVVTNDEIPPSPEAESTPAPSAAGPGSASAASSPADAKAADTKKPDKAKLPPEKQTRLQELEKDHDSLQKIIKQLQDEVASSNDQNRIVTLNGVIDHAKQALAENEKETAKLKASGAGGGASQTSPPASPK